MSTTIAVVEDDASILDALKLVLEAEGWRIQAYTTGEAFLVDLGAGFAPHCLILDPHLPGIDGVEVADAVIKGDAHTDTPIIVLTARPSSSVTRNIFNLGARTVLTKPVDAQDLINQVRAAICGIDTKW